MVKKPDPRDRFVWDDPSQIKIVPRVVQEKPPEKKQPADSESGAGYPPDMQDAAARQVLEQAAALSATCGVR